MTSNPKVGDKRTVTVETPFGECRVIEVYREFWMEPDESHEGQWIRIWVQA